MPARTRDRATGKVMKGSLHDVLVQGEADSPQHRALIRAIAKAKVTASGRFGNVCRLFAVKSLDALPGRIKSVVRCSRDSQKYSSCFREKQLRKP
jgi:hypothetical protein